MDDPFNNDVKEMLRASTILSYATFEFDKAVADGDRLIARKALDGMREAMNLANLSSERMRRTVERMPR